MPMTDDIDVLVPAKLVLAQVQVEENLRDCDPSTLPARHTHTRRHRRALPIIMQAGPLFLEHQISGIVVLQHFLYGILIPADTDGVSPL